MGETTRRHPNSQWDTGVPPSMGEHVMPSGKTAPLSTSTTVGTGAAHLFQYHAGETATQVQARAFRPAGARAGGMPRPAHSLLQVHPSASALNAAAVQLVCEVARAEIARKGAAVVALSGGSAASALAGLASASPPLDWARVHLFLVDERCVPAGDAACNASTLRSTFLEACGPAAASALHALADPTGPPAASAAAYAQQLLSLPPAALPRTADGLPIFDLVVLGMGPDTHTASLFANRPQMSASTQAYLPVLDSPKPPAQRVTLSLSAINAARRVAFLVSGAEKAEAVQRVLEVQALPGACPAQAVRPAAGELTWMLDAESASALSVGDWEKPARWPRSEFPEKSA